MHTKSTYNPTDPPISLEISTLLPTKPLIYPSRSSNLCIQSNITNKQLVQNITASKSAFCLNECLDPLKERQNNPKTSTKRQNKVTDMALVVDFLVVVDECEAIRWISRGLSFIFQHASCGPLSESMLPNNGTKHLIRFQK